MEQRRGRKNKNLFLISAASGGLERGHTSDCWQPVKMFVLVCVFDKDIVIVWTCNEFLISWRTQLSLSHQTLIQCNISLPNLAIEIRFYLSKFMFVCLIVLYGCKWTLSKGQMAGKIIKLEHVKIFNEALLTC